VELGTAFAGMCTNGSRYGVQPVPIHGVRMPPLGHPALWESPTTPLAGTGPSVHEPSSACIAARERFTWRPAISRCGGQRDIRQLPAPGPTVRSACPLAPAPSDRRESLAAPPLCSPGAPLGGLQPVATVARVQPAQELPRRPGRHSSYCSAAVATASSSVAAQ
jgi:hypothetical protein